MDSFSTASSSDPCSNKEATDINWPYRHEDEKIKNTNIIDRHGSAFWNLVFFLAGLAIKLLLFQINLVIIPITFPIWILNQFFVTLLYFRDAVMKSIIWISCSLLYKTSHKLQRRYKNSENIARRTFHRILRSLFVLSILLALLVTAFVAGIMIMQQIVEKPVMVERDLSFDYTKAKPDALISLDHAFLPYNRKLILTIVLTLPESDYNWKLGVFQVKSEFLSREGQVIHISSHPCMIQFKSSLIHYIITLVNSGYILFGYSLESQDLILRMPVYIEETEAVAHTRVVLEQRAEYGAPGAGIPEIYSAHMKLESEFTTTLKRVMWIWKWTLLIWISMGIFILELLIAAFCYRPILNFKRSAISNEITLQVTEFVK